MTVTISVFRNTSRFTQVLTAEQARLKLLGMSSPAWPKSQKPGRWKVHRTKAKRVPQWGRPDPADPPLCPWRCWWAALCCPARGLNSCWIRSCCGSDPLKTSRTESTSASQSWSSPTSPTHHWTHTRRSIYSNKPRILDLRWEDNILLFFVSGMILNVIFILYRNQLNSVWTWSSWTRVVSVVPWASGHGARVSLWPRGRLQSLFSSHTAASESSHLQRAGDKRRHGGLHKVSSGSISSGVMLCGSELPFHCFYLDQENTYFSPSLSSRSSPSGLCSQMQDSSPSHLQQELHCWLLDENIHISYRWFISTSASAAFFLTKCIF